MADRLTQLQDSVNQLADHLCNAVGILQQFTPDGGFVGFEKSTKVAGVSNDENTSLFSSLIAQTAKEIDTLINSLPHDDAAIELQMQSLFTLEKENADSGDQLTAVVDRGEKVMLIIQGALHDIAEAQLRSQALVDFDDCDIDVTDPIVSEDEVEEGGDGDGDTVMEQRKGLIDIGAGGDF